MSRRPATPWSERRLAELRLATANSSADTHDEDARPATAASITTPTASRMPALGNPAARVLLLISARSSYDVRRVYSAPPIAPISSASAMKPSRWSNLIGVVLLLVRGEAFRA